MDNNNNTKPQEVLQKLSPIFALEHMHCVCVQVHVQPDPEPRPNPTNFSVSVTKFLASCVAAGGHRQKHQDGQDEMQKTIKT